MTVHRLEPSRATLHGHFSRDLQPALTIDPGDTVVFRTLDAGWHLGEWLAGGEEPPVFARRPGPDDGHALCGPVAVRGAEPGDTLVVRIDALRPGAWGWTRAGGRRTFVNSRLGIDVYGIVHRWALDPASGWATGQLGHKVAVRPFMGVMGLAPAEPGAHSTAPPRACGGNMDCRELVAGSTLYLPVAVPEALFSTGDGHAAQGDGEVSGTAIECPMERAELTFSVDPELSLTTPCANTPAGWVTLGFHEDLDEAMVIALEAMLDLMGRQFELGRRDAIALASVVVDLRVTQVVNGVNGVHAVLPHGALQS